ncbi:hypothetical protein amrb99_51570 [Actinomadura sp. RB99]|uniref:hypothetical protein n=1 Tax=Actinomadura sp. RB99 TaxID=2691577 RepID=UPI00168210AC|nr:hypothetical protein [Actinomadura sp. RB99]MBD2896213.1 hypothetical protein [Actinomadura sp. RB99]
MTSPSLDQLVASAAYHADLALKAYTSGESRAILVNAAFSMEHVSKALLFSISPAYLVDVRNGHFDSLLLLTGHGDKATKLNSPRTIGAKEAVDRVSKVMDTSVTKDKLNHLVEVRDGVVHVGAFDATSTRELLTDFLRFSDEIYDKLNVPDEDRWGRHTVLVKSLVEQQWTEIEHEVHRKMTAALENLHDLTLLVPESEQAAVAEARQAVLAPLVHLQMGATGESRTCELVACPACEHPGAVCAGRVREECEAPDQLDPMDRADEVASPVEMWLEPMGLICHVCRLTLSNADELRVAGIPERLEITGLPRPRINAAQIGQILSALP